MELLIFFFILTLSTVSEGALPDTLLIPMGSETKSNCSCGKFFDMERAKRGEFPWLALLVNINDIESEPLCWGSLINDRYILSAAHCTSKYSSVEVEILVGSSHQNPRRQVASIKNHPGFIIGNSTFDNDISLIKLREPLDLEVGDIFPICLPPEVPQTFGIELESGNDTDTNATTINPFHQKLKLQLDEYAKRSVECDYVGNQIDGKVLMSMTVFKGHQTVEKKKTRQYDKLALHGFKDEACHKLYCDRIKAQFICADVQGNAEALGGSRKKCNGDSGGALMYLRKMKNNCDPDFSWDKESSAMKIRFLQIGISSSQGECIAPKTHPHPVLLFTRISRYRTWIRENTEDGTYCYNSP